MTATGPLGLRPAGPGDAEVLYRIYASTREDELAAVPWDAATKETFLRMQSAAQDRSYHATFPNASYDLIVSDAGTLGRLYVDRDETVWLVIDLALLPGHRGQGIGTRLLTELLADAGGPASRSRCTSNGLTRRGTFMTGSGFTSSPIRVSICYPNASRWPNASRAERLAECEPR